MAKVLCIYLYEYIFLHFFNEVFLVFCLIFFNLRVYLGLSLSAELLSLSMRGSRKFCQRGSNFDYFFSLMRGGRMNLPLLAGRHRPARETQLKRR